MNLYEIKEKLKKQEKAVFTLNEISRITNIKKKIMVVYTNRMLKKGLLFKIEKNKVSTTEDPFIIASQLSFPSYLSLTTALYLHGIIEQIINKIYVITTKKRKKINIFGTETLFLKVNPKLMFGYRKIKKENSFIMLADIEKAIIDCIYFPKSCPLNYIIEALKKADIKKLEYYLSILKKEIINRRLGYLLDLTGRKHSLKRNTNTIYKLNPSRKNKGKFNKKWYLYVNEELNVK